MALLLAAMLAQAAPAAAPVVAVEPWTTAAPLPGSWSYRATPDGSEAVFRSAVGTELTLRCTRASRTVEMVRSGAATGSSIVVRTTSLERTLPASATLGARDPLLDAIAYSRGRWLVETKGVSRLILPSWPEAARSIEDCRN